MLSLVPQHMCELLLDVVGVRVPVGELVREPDGVDGRL